MKNWLNYIASVGINVLIVFSYFKFIFARDGLLGLTLIYLAASIISVLVYIFRKKIFQVDAILGTCALIVVLLAMQYSWYILAEVLMALVIVYSFTYFFFDWKSLDDARAGKKTKEE